MIGVVLIGGLTMGRQVTQWWQQEPPQVAVAGADGGGPGAWGADGAAVQVEFGDFPVAMRRKQVSGDREAAMSALIAMCRAAVESPASPAMPAGDATDRLVAQTAKMTPVVEQANAWQVHRIDGLFPLVVGTRFARDGEDATAPVRRLVCCGLVMPANERSFTLFTFLPASAPAQGANGAPEVPLPQGCRRSLALRNEDGGGLIGFNGSGEADEWMSHFDARLRTQGWRRSAGWSAGASNWSARYEPEGPTRTGRVEIAFSHDGASGLTGLVEVVP